MTYAEQNRRDPLDWEDDPCERYRSYTYNHAQTLTRERWIAVGFDGTTKHKIFAWHIDLAAVQHKTGRVTKAVGYPYIPGEAVIASSTSAELAAALAEVA